MHTIDLKKYKYSRALITSLGLVDQKYYETKHFLNQWSDFVEELGIRPVLDPPKYIRVFKRKNIFNKIDLISKNITQRRKRLLFMTESNS